MKKIKIAPVNSAFPLPKQHLKGDAGYDLICIEDFTIARGETKLVQSNTKIQLEEGYFARITGRSGLSSLGILVHPGTVDSGYRGVMGINMTNLSPFPVAFAAGDRIAQFVIMKYYSPDFEEFESLDPSERGEKGFASTGI